MRRSFRFCALAQHNANVALMGIELLVTSLHVSLYRLPFAVLFGLAFLVWHQTLRFQRTRTLLCERPSTRRHAATRGAQTPAASRNLSTHPPRRPRPPPRSSASPAPLWPTDFFLNWSRPDAIRTLLVLFFAFAAYYALGYAVATYLRPTSWGAPILALLIVSIMRVRPPPPPE